MFDIPITAEMVRGALELEPNADGLLPHRLPLRARRQADDGQLLMTESQPAGVRLVFDTRASAIELDTRPTKRVYPGAPPRPDGVYDLLVDGELAAQTTVAGGNTLTVDLDGGGFETTPGPPGTARFDALGDRFKSVEIWLPWDEMTELVALRADAPVDLRPEHERSVWMHHGSSISQGSNAASASTTWPALAALQSGAELINLGFGGGALLDPFTSRAMRDTPADRISLEIGINLVNTDAMRLRAFTPAVHGFLDTIRDGHPDTPLLVISPLYCRIHEDVPGPSMPDKDALARGELRFTAGGDPAQRAAGKLTLHVIRDELAGVVAQRAGHDPHLHYLDGRELYGEDDYAARALPDEMHPDAQTHRLIGERFARLGF